MLDFDEIWYAAALWDPGGGLMIETGTESKNQQSAAAILNFAFWEYLGGGSKYLHHIR